MAAPCGHDEEMNRGVGGDAGDELLVEQRDFYQADARQFDHWLSTLVDDDNADLQARTYRTGRQRIAGVFEQSAPLGRVLEIAAGTGRLAELYLPHASSIVLLDSSSEMLNLAGERLLPARAEVTLIQADVFEWDDDGRTFDTVIFAAWLHHVPHSRFESFWRRIERLLTKEGEVIFDFPDARVPSSGRIEVPDEPTVAYSFYAPVDGISIRDHGGRRWRVVHNNLWDPADLSARLAELGWRMTALGPGLFDNVKWATARR